MATTTARAEALLAWGLPRLRDLPWRNTRDPWAVLVSEVMLQQTQVARVEPRWRAFLDRWPTATDCAEATLADVLREWQGLGYPRRAKHLHDAARQIHRDGMPATLDGLLALPGVGAYTARAVMAFAYHADVGVVDTNIGRVHARLAGRSLSPRVVQDLADAAVPRGLGWEWNQCLMDLGATCCRPTAPACARCPLQEWCAFAGIGVDPAPGSAAVSRPQSRFEGSDRQARGRLLRRLAGAPVGIGEVAALMQRDSTAALRLLDDLEREGLCTRLDGEVSLPVTP